ncbi:MAG: hypothetical protein ACYCUV_09025 [Phycisphaerae bacterium]
MERAFQGILVHQSAHRRTVIHWNQRIMKLLKILVFAPLLAAVH